MLSVSSEARAETKRYYTLVEEQLTPQYKLRQSRQLLWVNLPIDEFVFDMDSWHVPPIDEFSIPADAIRSIKNLIISKVPREIVRTRDGF